MSNHGWHDCDEEPIPDGEAVIVLFEVPVHGSRYAIHSSLKISNGYLRVINGIFRYDEPTKIVAWRRMTDLNDMIPMEILGKLK